MGRQDLGAAADVWALGSNDWWSGQDAAGGASMASACRLTVGSGRWAGRAPYALRIYSHLLAPACRQQLSAECESCMRPT